MVKPWLSPYGGEEGRQSKIFKISSHVFFFYLLLLACYQVISHLGFSSCHIKKFSDKWEMPTQISFSQELFRFQL